MYVTFDQFFRASLCVVMRHVPGTDTGESGLGDIGMSSVSMPSRLKPPFSMVAFGDGHTRFTPWRSCLVSSVKRAPTLVRTASLTCQVNCPKPAQADNVRCGCRKACE